MRECVQISIFILRIQYKLCTSWISVSVFDSTGAFVQVSLVQKKLINYLDTCTHVLVVVYVWIFIFIQKCLVPTSHHVSQHVMVTVENEYIA